MVVPSTRNVTMVTQSLVPGRTGHYIGSCPSLSLQPVMTSPQPPPGSRLQQLQFQERQWRETIGGQVANLQSQLQETSSQLHQLASAVQGLRMKLGEQIQLETSDVSGKEATLVPITSFPVWIYTGEHSLVPAREHSLVPAGEHSLATSRGT